MVDIINRIKAAVGKRPRQIPVPPSVPLLIQHRDNFWGCVPARSEDTDTPLHSLYRMYAALVMDNNIELRNEFEFFFNHSSKEWSLARLPDPQDTDPQRYAIVSVVPELLCESFNRLIEMSVPRDRPAIIDRQQEEELRAMPKVFETLPAWCAGVPALKDELVIANRDGSYPDGKDSEEADQRFAKKNIVIRDQTLFFT